MATLPSTVPRRPTDPAQALARPWTSWCDAAERAIADGASLLILQRPRRSPERAPIPACWPPSALHHGLVRRRLRSQAGIVVESGEPREVMHFCLLCGYGANAVNPYLAFETIHEAARRRRPAAGTRRRRAAIDHYITAVKKGLLKIMSKMGISTLRSYQRAQHVRGRGAEPRR